MQDQKLVTVTVKVPADVHRAARIKSVTTGTPLNSIMAKKLKEWVNEKKVAEQQERVN